MDSRPPKELWVFAILNTMKGSSSLELLLITCPGRWNFRRRVLVHPFDLIFARLGIRSSALAPCLAHDGLPTGPTFGGKRSRSCISNIHQPTHTILSFLQTPTLHPTSSPHHIHQFQSDKATSIRHLCLITCRVVCTQDRKSDQDDHEV